MDKISPIGRIAGEIVSWDFASGTKITYGALVAALDSAGLDKKAARTIAPRDAFARACWVLSEQKIIRRLAESAGEVKFQLTAESKETYSGAVRLAYNYEAILKLDKTNGQIECSESPELQKRATELIAAATDIRTTADISRVVQRLCEADADLFPVRAQGGCYFVPAPFVAFLEKLDVFIGAIGGSLRRFPIPFGYSASGDRSVKESVADGLFALVAEHMKAVDEFDPSTQDRTLKRTVERIQETRFKVEAYAEFLADKSAELLEDVKEARAKLRDKIDLLGRSVPVPEPEEAPKDPDQPSAGM